MHLLKPVLFSAIVLTALLGHVVAATERPPRVGETRILPNKPAGATPAASAKKPDKKPAKKPVKRRAVRQVLDDHVHPATPSVQSRPMTTPESMLPVPGVAPGPVNLNCVGGTCTDASGARYNGGIGTTLISPQGRLCTDNGLTVQCF